MRRESGCYGGKASFILFSALIALSTIPNALVAQSACDNRGGLTLSGKVEEVTPSGRLVPGVRRRVTLLGPDDRIVGRAITRLDGSYVLPGIRCGTYRIQVRSRGDVVAGEGAVTIGGAEDARVGTIRLPRSG